MSGDTPRPNFGPYKLQRLLGRGGMGEVYHAVLIRESGFSKPLVIKRILPAFTEQGEFIKRFLDEARLSARLNHRNIIHIYDFGKEEGIYYLAMEYIEGVSLDRVYSFLREGGLFPHSTWAHIGMEALDGLIYAHQFRAEDGSPLPVIHRDITPGNIFLSRSGEVKLGDFGLALVGKSSETGIAGTYAYMAPEQAAGLPADERSDIFGLAAALYEGIAGRPPRKLDEVPSKERIDFIREAQIPAPSEFGASVDADVEAWIMQGLAHKAKERFPSALVMQKELKEIILRRGWKDSANELGLFLQPFVTDISNPSINVIEATRVAGAQFKPTIEQENGAQYTFLKTKKRATKIISGALILGLLMAIGWLFLVIKEKNERKAALELAEKPKDTVAESRFEAPTQPEKRIIIEKIEEEFAPAAKGAEPQKKGTFASARREKAAQRRGEKPATAFVSDYKIDIKASLGKISAIDNAAYKGQNSINAEAGNKLIKLTDESQKRSLFLRLQLAKLSDNPNTFYMSMATVPWLNMTLNGISLTDEATRTRRELAFGSHRLAVFDDKGEAVIMANILVSKKP